MVILGVVLLWITKKFLSSFNCTMNLLVCLFKSGHVLLKVLCSISNYKSFSNSTEGSVVSVHTKTCRTLLCFQHGALNVIGNYYKKFYHIADQGQFRFIFLLLCV